jgi:hypothetical protein
MAEINNLKGLVVLQECAQNMGFVPRPIFVIDPLACILERIKYVMDVD